MILGLRELPLCRVVEKYHLMVMTLLYERRVMSKDWDPQAHVPRVQKHLEKMKEEYKNYISQGSTDFTHIAINTNGQRWTVDINARACSCCSWQMFGLSCVHAICVLIYVRRDL